MFLSKPLNFPSVRANVRTKYNETIFIGLRNINKYPLESIRIEEEAHQLGIKETDSIEICLNRHLNVNPMKFVSEISKEYGCRDDLRSRRNRD